MLVSDATVRSGRPPLPNRLGLIGDGDRLAYALAGIDWEGSLPPVPQIPGGDPRRFLAAYGYARMVASGRIPPGMQRRIAALEAARSRSVSSSKVGLQGFGAFGGDWWEDGWHDGHVYDTGSEERNWCDKNYPWHGDLPVRSHENEMHLRCIAKGRGIWVFGKPSIPFFAPWTKVGKDERGLQGGLIDDASKFAQSFDPTTAEGRERIAKILFPGPLSSLIIQGAKLSKCVGDSITDLKKAAGCFATFFIEHFKDVVTSPYFSIALAAASANPVGVIMAAAKLAGEVVMEAADALPIGQQDKANVKTIVKAILNAPDLVLIIANRGAQAFREAWTYHLIGGVVGSLGPGSTLGEIGFVIADNSQIIASIVQGNKAQTTKLVEEKYITPLKVTGDRLDPRHVKNTRDAAGLLGGLGAVLEALGRGIQKVPLAGAAGKPIEAAGRSLRETAQQYLSLVNELNCAGWHPGDPVPPGCTPKPPPKIVTQAEWEQRLRDAQKERDDWKKRAEAAEKRPASCPVCPPPQKTATPAPTTSSPSPGQKGPGAGVALALAAGGFLVGGPVGAVVGYGVGSQFGKEKA